MRNVAHVVRVERRRDALGGAREFRPSAAPAGSDRVRVRASYRAEERVGLQDRVQDVRDRLRDHVSLRRAVGEDHLHERVGGVGVDDGALLRE